MRNLVIFLLVLVFSYCDELDNYYLPKIQEKEIGKNAFDREWSSDELFFYVLGREYIKLKNYISAEKAYSRAIEIIPNFAEAYYELGLLSAKHRINYEKAFYYFNMTLTHKPLDPDANKQLGLYYLDNNMKQEAFTYLQAASIFNPYDIETLYILADINFSKKNVTGAVKLLNQTIKLDPKFGPGYYRLFNYSVENNQFIKAEFILKLAEKNGAPHIKMLYALAEHYKSKALFSKAESFYKKVVDKNYLFKDGIYKLGLVLKNQNKINQTIDLLISSYNKTKLSRKKQLNLLTLLIEVLESNQQPEKTLPFIKIALKLEPKNLSFLYKQAVAEYMLGKKYDTLFTLKQLIKIDKDNKMAWLKMGETYEDLEKYNDARKAYYQLLSRYPDFQSGLKRLKSLESKHFRDDIMNIDL